MCIRDRAYRQLSAVTDYPRHVGVTEAGTYQMGLLKSGMGIGGMLLEGIGAVSYTHLDVYKRQAAPHQQGHHGQRCGHHSH